MRRFYSALAWIVAGGVVVQAAAIAFGFGGMVGYIMDGGVVDEALMESRQSTFTGRPRLPDPRDRRRAAHPRRALVLGVSSFFVRGVPRREAVGVDRVRARVRPDHGRATRSATCPTSAPSTAPMPWPSSSPPSTPRGCPLGPASRSTPMRLAPASSSDRRRAAVVGIAAVGVLVAGGFGWASTRLGEYSVMTMGHVVDGGGGSLLGTGSRHHGVGSTTGGSDAAAGGGGAAAPASGVPGPADRRRHDARSGPGATGRRPCRARCPPSDGAGSGRPRGRGLHPQRHLPRADDPRPSGPARRGHPRQRVGRRRGHTALARRRRPQRRRRRRRSHPGCRARRRTLRLPVRGAGRRHLLVPLAPDVPRAGRARAARCARRRARGATAPRPRPWTRWPCSTSTPVSTP